MKSNSYEEITVSSHEVAEQHFNEAVLLFFERRSPISICHLAHAAHEILSKKTKDSFIHHNSLLTDEGKKIVWAKISEDKNFAKHPSEKSLTFNKLMTEIILMDCALMIKKHMVNKSLETNAFLLWMSKSEPGIFTQEGHDEFKMAAKKIDVTDFENMVKIIRRHRKLK